MSVLRAAFCACALVVAAAAPAAPAQATGPATPWVDLHAARARLLAGPATVAGGHYLAGLEIVLDEGWKTYWRMPGDAGVPPTFDWAGSVNVAAVRVLYPAPMRMPEAGGEVVGYKRAVLLPIEVTPQDPGKPVALKLALEVGICREICIPATASFSLEVAPGRAGAPAREIVAALERVPRPQASRRPGDPELRRVALERDGPVARLIIEAAFDGAGQGADVFVEAPEGHYVPLPKRLQAGAGGIVRFASDLPRGLDKDLAGKTLTLTLIGEAGASEAKWTVP